MPIKSGFHSLTPLWEFPRNFWPSKGVFVNMDKLHSGSFVVVAAAVLFGVFLGVVGTILVRPNASSPRVYSAPQPLASFVESLAVEAYVDSNGRVQDYRVLSEAKSLPPQAKNVLIFTTFRPATFMGKPISGTATLIFFQTNPSAVPTLQTQ
jgi:hypothetical protein